MDQQQPVVADTANMDGSSSRLSTERMIAEGVELVLAIRAGENALDELSKEFRVSAHTHDIQYILQEAEVNKLRKALGGITESLAALPHTPVTIEPDLGQFRAWINVHRARFDGFKTFCDEYRPKSPREEGEVHPYVEHLSSALKDMEHRLDQLAPVVNPDAFELESRAERMAEAQRRHSQLFRGFLDKFDFMKLGEAGQRLAVEQRVLKVARETLDGMVNMENGNAERDAFLWLQPVDPQTVDHDHEMEIVT
ncbi:hypothetical protein DFH09DRAFT_1133058 [Mycena vulgaris]|nr:hypothetical protein DFH09DRAFT_1133058 [Mycena vulgaris]